MTADRYQRLINELAATGKGVMQCRGNSMLPILTNPCVNHYEKEPSYAVGDIVFCRVKGRFIDAHKITASDGTRYLISNNRGYNNGWTRTIYGRVVMTEDSDGTQRRL